MLFDVYYKLLSIINSPAFLRGFFDNRFYLILLVIILLRMKYTTYSSMWLSALVNIPGTLLHETMHFMVGLFLNAHPCNFTLFPRRGEDGYYVMGSVGSGLNGTVAVAADRVLYKPLCFAGAAADICQLCFVCIAANHNY